jgi:peptide-N4-(N-acetyl-beta-glucosaminyl)asparagine amidase
MADKPHRPSRLPASTGDFDVTELSKEFENLMRSKKFADFQQQSRCDSRTGSPAPSQSQYLAAASSPRPSRRLPIMPHPPRDAVSVKFCNLLRVLSVTPTKYENPGLLDDALTAIPLDRLYAEADDEHQIHQAQSASVGKKPQWGYQDFVIQSLLK